MAIPMLHRLKKNLFACPCPIVATQAAVVGGVAVIIVGLPISSSPPPPLSTTPYLHCAYVKRIFFLLKLVLWRSLLINRWICQDICCSCSSKGCTTCSALRANIIYWAISSHLSSGQVRNSNTHAADATDNNAEAANAQKVKEARERGRTDNISFAFPRCVWVGDPIISCV